MKSVIFILSLVFVFLNSFAQTGITDEEQRKALAFIEEEKGLIKEVLGANKNKRDEMMAIVFPEIIRFSMFKDFVETSALKTLYTNYGSKTVDFSIGHFQMKPSFIETLENNIRRNPSIKACNKRLIMYPSDDPVDIRKERVKRLADLEWQLMYLKAFHLLMKEKYGHIVFQSTAGKIQFYATAYNHGFLAGENNIKKWIHKKTYPYGAGRPNPLSYAEVAVQFYQTNK